MTTEHRGWSLWLEDNDERAKENPPRVDGSPAPAGHKLVFYGRKALLRSQELDLYCTCEPQEPTRVVAELLVDLDTSRRWHAGPPKIAARPLSVVSTETVDEFLTRMKGAGEEHISELAERLEEQLAAARADGPPQPPEPKQGHRYFVLLPPGAAASRPQKGDFGWVSGGCPDGKLAAYPSPFELMMSLGMLRAQRDRGHAHEWHVALIQADPASVERSDKIAVDCLFAKTQGILRQWTLPDFLDTTAPGSPEGRVAVTIRRELGLDAGATP